MSSTRFHATKLWNNIVETFVTKCPRVKHTRFFTIIGDSFTGKEAISCLLKEFPLNPYTKQKLTKEQACKLLGKMLQERKYFYRVNAKKGQEKIFKDGNTLYCFYHKSQANDTVTNCTVVSTKEEKTFVLNKVDEWSIYSQSFFWRLSTLINFDSFFSLDVRGSILQENCEEKEEKENFPNPVMALINYLYKLPFSMDNVYVMKVFNHLSEYIWSLPIFFKEIEAELLLEIYEELGYKLNKKEILLKMISLLFLTLEPPRRHKLLIILRLMVKISEDGARDQVLETFTSSIIPCERIRPRQAVPLIEMLMDNLEHIFKIDEELIKKVEEKKRKMREEKESSSTLVNTETPDKQRRGKNELNCSVEMLNEFNKQINEGEEEEKEDKMKKVVIRRTSQKILKRRESHRRRNFFTRVVRNN